MQEWFYIQYFVFKYIISERVNVMRMLFHIESIILLFFLLLPWQTHSSGWTETNQLISDEIFIIKIWPTQIKAEVSLLPQSLTLSQVIFHFLCAWLCSTAMLLWINIKWWLEEDRGCVQNGIQAHYLLNTAQDNLYYCCCCFFVFLKL